MMLFLISRQMRPHPNVCKLLGVSESVNSPLCLVMEFLSEGNLWSALKEQRLDLQPSLFYVFARDIASGMQHLHV